MMAVTGRWSGREAAALRLARRMSVRAYAAHLGVAAATVGNWDRRGDRARLRTETQQLLDIDLGRASDEVRQRFEVILASEADDVKRRGFLAGGGAALVGALVPGALASAKIASGVSSRAAETRATLGRAILAPPSRPDRPPLTAAAVAAGAEQAWQLRQRAEYQALGALLSALIPEAEACTANAEEQDVEQAGEALVHVYNAASSLLKRLGDDSLAAIAADRAVRTAERFGAALLTAAAKYRLANVLLVAGRLDEAQAVALDAADLVDPGRVSSTSGLATWGGLLLTAAVSAARTSDLSRTWEFLGEARTAGQLLGADHADMYAIFGPTNVAIHCVQVAVELRDGRDAVRRGNLVDPNHLPAGLVERRGQFLIDMAHAHTLAGDDHAATAALVEATRVALQEVELSGDAHGVLRGLLSRPHGGRTPELRALAIRIGLDQ
jgi:hypothetical protein